MKLDALLVGIMLLIAVPAQAQPVIRDGKEWLQPIDFVGLSWDDVAVVCSPSTGACSGELESFNVTGYRWASVHDVNALFNSYGVHPLLVGPSVTTNVDSGWAPAFLMDFSSMDSYFQYVFPYVQAWSRTLVSEPAGIAYMPYLRDAQAPSSVDIATSDNYDVTSNGSIDLGVWLYKPTSTAVPVSGTYVLALTVLGLVVVAVRRLSRRSGKQG